MLWGPNQPVVTGAVSPEVDWPESETDCSGPFGTETKNVSLRLSGLVVR